VRAAIGCHPEPSLGRQVARPWQQPRRHIGSTTSAINRPVELLRYIELLEESLGRKAQMNMLPLQAGDVPDTWADISDLQRDVGYTPSTPFEVGIRRFVDWYLAYYGKDAPATPGSSSWMDSPAPLQVRVTARSIRVPGPLGYSQFKQCSLGQNAQARTAGLFGLGRPRPTVRYPAARVNGPIST
jgi:hypothetical protein